MLLYDAERSGNCWKVRQLFAHLGIAYETREIDVVDRSRRVEQLGQLNPALRIPVVVEDDGTVHAESNAILLHFAEGSSLLPDDRRLRDDVLRWLFFEQGNQQAYFAMPWYLIHVMPADPDPAVLDFARLMGRTVLRSMEAHLEGAPGGFFVGGAYSVADIALYPYTARAHLTGLDVQAHPAVTAWLRRVEAQPGFIPATV